MLEIRNLAVDFGRTRVVSGLDLALGADEIVVLVGPTGCGKTTVLNAIAGLVPIAAGEIRLGNWCATPSRHVRPEHRHIGMVFQDFALFPHLNVEQNVCFRLDDTAAADHWLARLGLEAFRRARPGTLSGGQKQRVALARALAHEPGMLLLDEPLSNLDASLKDSLRWEIRSALKQAGVPAIWVTHDQAEALSVADRLGILESGRLVQLDTPERCFRRPANRFVAGFLGEANFLPGRLERDRVVTGIGTVPAISFDGISGTVDVLLRPDAIALRSDGAATNGTVAWARYEGNTWLYTVNLDTGVTVQVRTSHATRVEPGEHVCVEAAATDAQAVFERVASAEPDAPNT